MIKKNNQSGITLIALIVTIIVILILVGISIYEGTKLIEEAKIETIETNMLTLQAKAKGFAEDVEAQVWAIEDIDDKQDAKNEAFNEYGMIKADDVDLAEDVIESLFNFNYENTMNIDFYYMKVESLENMGLNNLTDEKINVQNLECASRYLIAINADDYKMMDIIYVSGIMYKNNWYYTLSTLQRELEVE